MSEPIKTAVVLCVQKLNGSNGSRMSEILSDQQMEKKWVQHSEDQNHFAAAQKN